MSFSHSCNYIDRIQQNIIQQAHSCGYWIALLYYHVGSYYDISQCNYKYNDS